MNSDKAPTEENQEQNFRNEAQERIRANSKNDHLISVAAAFNEASYIARYTYNFNWLGRPVIQYPQDILAMQELIWEVKPDLIIETGIAHGGSLIFSASMLAILDMCESHDSTLPFDSEKKARKVLGIDIDIRPHNSIAIETHPLSSHIQMIQGSSIASDVIEEVREIVKEYEIVLVCLDSNHSHKHVLTELEVYGPLVSKGSYCIVFDTIIEDMRASLFSDRPWGPGNNPKTAVWEYLKDHTEFEIEKNMENKILITMAPEGFLRKVK